MGRRPLGLGYTLLTCWSFESGIFLRQGCLGTGRSDHHKGTRSPSAERVAWLGSAPNILRRVACHESAGAPPRIRTCATTATNLVLLTDRHTSNTAGPVRRRASRAATARGRAVARQRVALQRSVD